MRQNADGGLLVLDVRVVLEQDFPRSGAPLVPGQTRCYPSRAVPASLPGSTRRWRRSLAWRPPTRYRDASGCARFRATAEAQIAQVWFAQLLLQPAHQRIGPEAHLEVEGHVPDDQKQIALGEGRFRDAREAELQRRLAVFDVLVDALQVGAGGFASGGLGSVAKSLRGRVGVARNRSIRKNRSTSITCALKISASRPLPTMAQQLHRKSRSCASQVTLGEGTRRVSFAP